MRPEFAVLEVCNSLPASQVMDLVSRACQRGLTSPAKLDRAMRGRHLKHRLLINAVLAELRDGSTTNLEIAGTKFILRDHGLPTGLAQAPERSGNAVIIRDRLIGSLIIEFDGRLGHADPASRFRDLYRDNRAAISGRTTLRFGWDDVHEHACEAADLVAYCLGVRVIACGANCGSKLR